MFIISSQLLNNILEHISLEFENVNSKNIDFFTFHLLKENENLIFQCNYSNNIYIKYKITINKLLFFDSFEFNQFILNYHQIIKLKQICTLNLEASLHFKKENEYLFIITHSTDSLSSGGISSLGSLSSGGIGSLGSLSIKFKFILKDCEDCYLIVPPPPNISIPFIEINRLLLLNILKITYNPKIYTSIELKNENNQKELIFGQYFQDSISSTIQLPEYLIFEPSFIYINPDSIIHFLDKVKVDSIKIKIHESLSFMINCKDNEDEIDYFLGHEID